MFHPFILGLIRWFESRNGMQAKVRSSKGLPFLSRSQRFKGSEYQRAIAVPRAQEMSSIAGMERVGCARKKLLRRTIDTPRTTTSICVR